MGGSKSPKKHTVKSRCYALELYPEDEKHCDILDYIMAYFDYAYILHDKDKFDEDVIDEETKEVLHKAGEKKKPHWHVLLSFKNPRTPDSLKKELNIAHVEPANFYAYSRYLVHKDSPQKYQYSEREIHTNMELRIVNALSRNYNAGEQDTRILLTFLKNHGKDSYVTFSQLVDFAMENDCLLEVKRNTYFYKQFCDEFGFKRW